MGKNGKTHILVSKLLFNFKKRTGSKIILILDPVRLSRTPETLVIFDQILIKIWSKFWSNFSAPKIWAKLRFLGPILVKSWKFNFFQKKLNFSTFEDLAKIFICKWSKNRLCRFFDQKSAIFQIADLVELWAKSQIFLRKIWDFRMLRWPECLPSFKKDGAFWGHSGQKHCFVLKIFKGKNWVFVQGGPKNRQKWRFLGPLFLDLGQIGERLDVRGKMLLRARKFI